MTPGVVRVSADWLDLREPADAAARAEELVEPVRRYLTGRPLATVHDLGAGTGSMGRWLAPRLPGAQHWVLHDRDPDLLKRAADGIASTTADGAPVTVEVREDDITELRPGDLDGASLVTASALLDMLTGEEIDGIVAACASAGCPVLLTISVVGRVELTPPDPLDSPIAEAFNAHQRRTIAGDACGAGASRRLTAGDACGAGASRRLTEGRRLLGPDAVHAAAEAFRRYGMDVRLRPSPWRLGPDQAGLAVEWLRGWLDAACEQRPELTGPARSYETRRLADARAGQLRVVVHHCDLLAGWR